MKELVLVFSLVLGATLLTSCTRVIQLHVFNHTSSAIIVVSHEANSKETRYLIEKDQSERVRLSNRLTVNCDTTVWNYDVRPVPKTTTYMSSERFGPLVVKLQVEKDGTIYVLSPKTLGIVTNLPPQPPGYPIRPTSK